MLNNIAKFLVSVLFLLFLFSVGYMVGKGLISSLPTIKTVKAEKTIYRLNPDYAVCVSAAELSRAEIDNMHCMATADVENYTIDRVKVYRNSIVEITFSFEDDVTAVLWSHAEAVGVLHD